MLPHLDIFLRLSRDKSVAEFAEEGRDTRGDPMPTQVLPCVTLLMRNFIYATILSDAFPRLKTEALFCYYLKIRI